MNDGAVEQLLDQAEAAFAGGSSETTLQLCAAILDVYPDHTLARYLAAEAHRDLGDNEAAEHHYRKLILALPHHSASFGGLGAVLFNQLRFIEAAKFINRAIREDDGNSEAFYWRALLRERRNDLRGARRDYRRARNLDPARFPMPKTLNNDEISELMIEALGCLSNDANEFLGDVNLVIEEIPPASLCSLYSPPAPPGRFLGYFQGQSVDIDDSGAAVVPSTIVLFRKNIERIAWDRDRLLDELILTFDQEISYALRQESVSPQQDP